MIIQYINKLLYMVIIHKNWYRGIAYFSMTHEIIYMKPNKTILKYIVLINKND